MKNVVRVAMGTRKNKRHKKNGYAPVPATTEFVHLNIRGGPMKEIEKWSSAAVADIQKDKPQILYWVKSTDVKKLLHQTRSEALEDAAKFLEENGWNDALPMTVNMREVAYRYARCIRTLAKKEERV